MKKPNKAKKLPKAMKPVEMMGPAVKKAEATRKKTFPRLQAGRDRGGF